MILQVCGLRGFIFQKKQPVRTLLLKRFISYIWFLKVRAPMTANRRLLLMSTGMAAVLFYVLHVILGGFLWQGYSQPASTHQ